MKSRDLSALLIAPISIDGFSRRYAIPELFAAASASGVA